MHFFTNSIIKSSVLLGCTLVFLTSCREDPQLEYDLGYDYYPETIGTYVEYEVTEIVHDNAVSIHDTSHYYLKEQIESSFIDDEGRKAYRIERFKKDSLHHSWQISDVWVSVKTTTHLEKVEENETFLRLLFGVKNDKEWDGNAANTRDAWEYTYKDVDEPFNMSGESFSQTTRIIQRDFRVTEIPIAHEYVEEIYARNVGLVKKYHKELRSIGFNDTTNVLEGYELYMDYMDHGVE